jgi:hypothetical protein
MHGNTLTGAALVPALLLVLVGAPGSSAAQRAAAASGDVQSSGVNVRIRTWTDPGIATLMLVESLGYADARAVVVRRPGDAPNNIILVTRATTPADLAHAASALITSRRSRGDNVDREIRALIGAPPVDGVPVPDGRRPEVATAKRAAGAPPSRSEQRAAADLARLGAAPVFTIPGVGRGPALVIRMSDAQRPAKR